MSAWRIGREASGGAVAVAAEAQPPPWKQYVDRLVKYIPGDALGGYTAAITLFLLTDGSPDPTLWLVILFTALAPALVILGWLSTPSRQAVSTIIPDILLAMVAFVAWSITVPGNGWLEIEAIGDEPAIAGLIGLLAGILLPLIAKALNRQ